MNNHLSYTTIGVFLVLVLFMAMMSFDKGTNIIELSGVNNAPDSDCFVMKRQCMEVFLNDDGSFLYKGDRYDIKQLSETIISKYPNMDTVHLFLNSPGNMEHQYVTNATNSLARINPRIKVSWIHE